MMEFKLGEQVRIIYSKHPKMLGLIIGISPDKSHYLIGAKSGNSLISYINISSYFDDWSKIPDIKKYVKVVNIIQ